MIANCNLSYIMSYVLYLNLDEVHVFCWPPQPRAQLYTLAIQTRSCFPSTLDQQEMFSYAYFHRIRKQLTAVQIATMTFKNS